MPHLVLVDGYIDEPASLGVPPYSSPQIRAVYGAARDAGADVTLLSIDDVRRGAQVPPCDVLVILSGCAVPGRYLRGMPASEREISELASQDRRVIPHPRRTGILRGEGAAQGEVRSGGRCRRGGGGARDLNGRDAKREMAHPRPMEQMDAAWRGKRPGASRLPAAFDRGAGDLPWLRSLPKRRMLVLHRAVEGKAEPSSAR